MSKKHQREQGCPGKRVTSPLSVMLLPLTVSNNLDSLCPQGDVGEGYGKWEGSSLRQFFLRIRDFFWFL
jgi:hypothetical protein